MRDWKPKLFKTLNPAKFKFYFDSHTAKNIKDIFYTGR